MLTYQPSTHWSKRKRRRRRKRWIMEKEMERIKCIRWNKMYQSMCVDQMIFKVKVKQWETRNGMKIGGQEINKIFFGIFNIKK